MSIVDDRISAIGSQYITDIEILKTAGFVVPDGGYISYKGFIRPLIFSGVEIVNKFNIFTITKLDTKEEFTLLEFNRTKETFPLFSLKSYFEALSKLENQEIPWGYTQSLLKLCRYFSENELTCNTSFGLPGVRIPEVYYAFVVNVWLRVLQERIGDTTGKLLVTSDTEIDELEDFRYAAKDCLSKLRDYKNNMFNKKYFGIDISEPVYSFF